jgi:hypothetical protein
MRSSVVTVNVPAATSVNRSRFFSMMLSPG